MGKNKPGDSEIYGVIPKDLIFVSLMFQEEKRKYGTKNIYTYIFEDIMVEYFQNLVKSINLFIQGANKSPEEQA